LKTLYLECNMGISGDMFLSALLELTESAAASLEKLNAMGLKNTRFETSPTVKCGIAGTHTDVTMGGVTEHAHPRGHHEHQGAGLSDVTEIISSLNIPQGVRDCAVEVYNIVAQAESAVHGRPVDMIHFHELGQLDAIADITGVCLLLNELGADNIIASPINTGFGFVNCAHGVLPVPAPATAHILKGVPVYAGNIEGELTTPTGAALIKYFAKDFCRMPCMTVEKIGVGMGFKDFPAANMLRAYLGHINESSCTNDEITELTCNLDDMTAEALGYAVNILSENGALDVFTTAAQMKKNRPGFILTCLCRPNEADFFAALILKHTSTFGVRKNALTRYALNRLISTIETKYGPIRIKTGEGFGINKCKPEFDDVASAARKCNADITDVYNETLTQIRGSNGLR